MKENNASLVKKENEIQIDLSQVLEMSQEKKISW